MVDADVIVELFFIISICFVIVIAGILIIRIGMLRLLNKEKKYLEKLEKNKLIQKYRWRIFVSVYIPLLFLVYFVILPLMDFAKSVVNLHDTLVLILPSSVVFFVFTWYGYRSSKMMKGIINNSK